MGREIARHLENAGVLHSGVLHSVLWQGEGWPAGRAQGNGGFKVLGLRTP